MKRHEMQFHGSVLERGFWIYVWRVDAPDQTLVYVGRTGDSSSANASSPFRRIGQHLDEAPHAKGNALARRLREVGVRPSTCRFSMDALGPIFPEQETFEDHKVFRDRTAALERAVASWIDGRGYRVLGVHHARHEPDPELLRSLIELLSPSFPVLGASD